MDRNPYAPPSAEVGETRVPMPVPVPVKTALSLFCLSLVSTVPHVVYRFTGLRSGGHIPTLDLVAAMTGLLIMLGLATLVFAGIWKGWRWARILFAIVVVLGTYNAFTAVPIWFRRSTFLGATDLLSVVADVAALALLFTPAANAFFRNR